MVASLRLNFMKEILNEIRDLYINQFLDALKDHKDSIIEPAMRLENGCLALDGKLNLPLRLDLVHENASISVDSNKKLSFSEIDFIWGGSLKVGLNPFCWDSMVCTFDKTNDSDWTLLYEWFMKWFDEDDQSPALKNNLYGVVHFLSDPEPCALGFQINIDFGSSTIEAFEETYFSSRVFV